MTEILDDDIDTDLPPEGSPDDLFSDLLSEFGDGSKKPAKSRDKKSQAVAAYYTPPAPKWLPHSRTMRVVVQHCSCCGEVHHNHQGVFFEERAEDARRYRPDSECFKTAELPSRVEYAYEEISECKFCFMVDKYLHQSKGE